MSLSAALETGDVGLLPSRRDEDWRWTDLRGLLRVLPPRALKASVATWGEGPFAGLVDETLVLAGGAETVSLHVPEGVTQTIALRVISEGDTALHASATIRVSAGSKLVLMESYEGDAGAYVTSVDLNFELEPGARLERVALAMDGADGVLVSKAVALLGGGATFTQTLATSGARRQRLETSVDHPGAGANVHLNGVYLLAGKRHADLTTTVRHMGVDGQTQQLTKGVVRDQARGVFQGRIIVEEGADRTEARMGHHALVLSDKAEVDAKPELLIHADDVQCAHGNTIGALDEEALFYMAQRGLPDGVARTLLVAAFVSEAIEGVQHDGARAVLEAWIAKAMEVAP